MKACRVCNGAIAPFMSFGRMPIANGFLKPAQFDDEYFYELAVAFCPDCGMVQLVDEVEPERMFHEHYAFFSSTSTAMAAHFKELAGLITRDYLGAEDPFVVEIGSNDGITLQHIAGAGLRHLGIEPSRNVAQVAMDKGIQTVCEFFNAELARTILAEHGQADVFLGSNVMCHISDLPAVFAGVKILLKPNGVLIFEDPYLGDIVQ